MRYLCLLTLIVVVLYTLPQAWAQSISLDEPRRGISLSGVGDKETLGTDLARERYETALARERAQQAYFNHQARMYESQQDYQDIYLKRSDHERRYNERSDDITNMNQIANTVTSVVRQIQVLSGGRGGW